MNRLASIFSILLLAAAPAQAADATPAAVIERVKGTKLYVRDLDRAIRFYTEVFGLKVARSIAEFPGKPVNEAILTQSGEFDMGDTTWLILKVPSAAEGAPPAEARVTTQLVVIVSDAKTVSIRARKSGQRIDHFDNGILVVHDPDGHEIEMLPSMSGLRPNQR